MHIKGKKQYMILWLRKS